MKLFFIGYLNVKLGRVNMSFCGKCYKMYASRQSLSQHRKRQHPEETMKEKNDKVNLANNTLKRKLSSEMHPEETTKEKNVKLANDIVNGILKRPPIGIVNEKNTGR